MRSLKFGMIVLLTLILSVSIIEAGVTRTTYSPFTGKLDYILDYMNFAFNFSLGNNSLTDVDMIIPTIDDNLPAWNEGAWFYINGNIKKWCQWTNVENVSVCLGDLAKRGIASEVIPKCKAVYQSGQQGQRPEWSMACANCTQYADVVGITMHDCSASGSCWVMLQGTTDCDTSQWGAGDHLYMTPQPRDGNISNVLPAIGLYTTHIGDVLTSSVTGQVSVDIRIEPTTRATFENLVVRNQTWLLGNATVSGNVYSVEDSDLLDPTGFAEEDKPTSSFDNTTMNLSLTGGFTWYINGVRCQKNNDSIIVSNTTGMHYIYYDDCTGLKQSTTAWSFEGITQVATLYWNGHDFLLGNEKHGSAMSWKTHEYVHETIGTRFSYGLAGTFNDTAFTIGAGEYYDDDIEYSFVQNNTCDLMWRNASYVWQFNKDTTQYYYKNATNMYYDNNGVLTAVGVNQYMAIWVFASNTNGNEGSIICIVGQRSDTTIANARANNVYESLSLGSLPSAEMKLLYRVIVQNDATPYVETQDYRTTSGLSGASYTPSDHGALAGLLDDDHSQYYPTDGSRQVNWTHLVDYPVACPANTYVVQINDTITCQAITEIDNAVNVHGDININRTSGGQIAKLNLVTYSDSILIPHNKRINFVNVDSGVASTPIWIDYTGSGQGLSIKTASGFGTPFRVSDNQTYIYELIIGNYISANSFTGNRLNLLQSADTAAIKFNYIADFWFMGIDPVTGDLIFTLNENLSDVGFRIAKHSPYVSNFSGTVNIENNGSVGQKFEVGERVGIGTTADDGFIVNASQGNWKFSTNTGGATDRVELRTNDGFQYQMIDTSENEISYVGMWNGETWIKGGDVNGYVEIGLARTDYAAGQFRMYITSPPDGSGAVRGTYIENDYSSLNTAGDGYSAFTINAIDTDAGADGNKTLFDFQTDGLSKLKMYSNGDIYGRQMKVKHDDELFCFGSETCHENPTSLLAVGSFAGQSVKTSGNSQIVGQYSGGTLVDSDSCSLFGGDSLGYAGKCYETTSIGTGGFNGYGAQASITSVEDAGGGQIRINISEDIGLVANDYFQFVPDAGDYLDGRYYMGLKVDSMETNTSIITTYTYSGDATGYVIKGGEIYYSTSLGTGACGEMRNSTGSVCIGSKAGIGISEDFGGLYISTDYGGGEDRLIEGSFVDNWLKFYGDLSFDTGYGLNYSYIKNNPSAYWTLQNKTYSSMAPAYQDINYSQTFDTNNLINLLFQNKNQVNETIFNKTLLYINFDNLSALGENQTVFYDISPINNTGTCVLASGFCPTWTSSGHRNGAYDFDASNDYVRLPKYEEYQFGTGDFTMASWWYPTSTPSVSRLFSGGNGTTADKLWTFGWGNVWGGGQGLDWAQWTGSSYQDYYVTGVTVNLNQWNHIFVIKENSRILFYLNNVLVYNQSHTRNVNTESFGVIIGARNQHTNVLTEYSNDIIDEVMIINRSITTTERNRLYISGLRKINSTTYNFSTTELNVSSNNTKIGIHWYNGTTWQSNLTTITNETGGNATTYEYIMPVDETKEVWAAGFDTSGSYKTNGSDYSEFKLKLNENETMINGDVVCRVEGGYVTRIINSSCIIYGVVSGSDAGVLGGSADREEIYDFTVKNDVTITNGNKTTDKSLIIGQRIKDDWTNSKYVPFAYIGEKRVKIRGTCNAGDDIVATGLLDDGAGNCVNMESTTNFATYRFYLKRRIGTALEKKETIALGYVKADIGK